MPFTINTNIASLQAQNYLRTTSDFQSKTINRVTSGLRIVASGDDAAGLAIANTYRSDEAVLAQGVRNGNDGLSQLQTADGGINNISQLLDRARTLATQSASGAFTGDRSVLNSEFQSVIGEIDRQAQAVGLSQGGQFARAFSVFIGGGKESNGITATVNGSVALDLSHSTVDSSSLGLKGVQAIGTAGTDIGSGSVATSLSQVLANAANTSSVATPGFTTFVIKGPGFDGNGVKLSVNTANLGGTSDLATAVNAAIAAAGNGGTQQATAFKNATVVAGINTDANGKQQLVFKSSAAAFQVEAGDKLANALLGNFDRNAVSTGTDTNPYVDSSGANDVLTFAVDGASTFDVTVTQAAGTSKGQIVKDLNANNSFSAVATAYLNRNQIAIKSKTNGATSSVAVTSSSGTLAATLGFSGTAAAAAASTGAELNVRVHGAGAVAVASNVIGTDSAATATLVSGASDTLILTVGATGPTTLTLTGGTGLTKAQIAADINTQIGGSALANKVAAKVVNNQIVLTAAAPGQPVTIGNGTADAALGFTNATVSSTNTVATSDTITLRFQGSGLASPVDITLNATTGGTTTTAQVLTDLQTKIAASGALTAAGISLSTSTAGNNLVFTSNKGEQFQVTATGDSTNVLGLGSFQSGSGSAVDYTSITAGSAYSTSGAAGTATFEVSLNGKASSANGLSADLTSGDAVAGSRTGTVVYAAGVVDLSAGAGTLKLAFRIDGGAIVQTASLGTSATTTISSILSAINTALGSNGTATLNGSGNIVITSATKGRNSSVEIAAAGAGASDTNVLTKLGFAAGATHGTNASETNVIQQLNNSIASNSTLVAAGLQAKDNGSGKIQIVSNNNTYFRLDARAAGSGYSGDAGFGFTGSSFTGQAQGAAPATSPYVDAQGGDATAVLAYSDTLYGSDAQTVSIAANDGNGVKHSLSVALHNDTTARHRTIMVDDEH